MTYSQRIDHIQINHVRKEPFYRLVRFIVYCFRRDIKARCQQKKGSPCHCRYWLVTERHQFSSFKDIHRKCNICIVWLVTNFLKLIYYYFNWRLWVSNISVKVPHKQSMAKNILVKLTQCMWVSWQIKRVSEWILPLNFDWNITSIILVCLPE